MSSFPAGPSGTGEGGKRQTPAYSRRLALRVPGGTSEISANWLDEHRMMSGSGPLLDISLGGLSARMVVAPPLGRLLHARLFLNTEADEGSSVIDANVQVCSRNRSSAGQPSLAAWIVHLAFESIHPPDAKRMVRALAQLGAKRS